METAGRSRLALSVDLRRDDVVSAMLFFERILNSKQAYKEQRRAARYAVGAAFPLKSVLNLVGCDEFDEALASPDGQGWNWTGRLINFSASGVSMQLPAATAARRGDNCSLILSLADYELTIPCHVAHTRKHPGSVQFGLKFDFPDDNTPEGYRQLLELVAFGASLRPEKSRPDRPDESGYVVENYHGDFESHLTVWRGPGGAVQWFEFQLAQYCVRGSAQNRTLEFAAGGRKNRAPVAAGLVGEVHQLFKWVVPNIARAVPADIRQSLQSFAA